MPRFAALGPTSSITLQIPVDLLDEVKETAQIFQRSVAGEIRYRISIAPDQLRPSQKHDSIGDASDPTVATLTVL